MLPFCFLNFKAFLTNTAYKTLFASDNKTLLASANSLKCSPLYLGALVYTIGLQIYVSTCFHFKGADPYQASCTGIYPIDSAINAGTFFILFHLGQALDTNLLTQTEGFICVLMGS